MDMDMDMNININVNINKKIENLHIAYIGGGSMGWAWGLMSDLASEPRLAGEVRLYDIDFPAAKRNEQIGNRYKSHPDCKGFWSYIACGDIAQALEGADFVVLSILPGDFDAMASDVHTPEKYGIYQSVGDTTGPGGLLRALRTVPMYEVIAKAIRRYAPTAWVINYTNPMAICTSVLYHIFPEIKAFGCCHEVFGTQEILANLLQDFNAKEGIAAEEITREDIRVNVQGLNHFTWLDTASWRNIDLIPLYASAVAEYGASGYVKAGKEHWMNSYFTSGNRVKLDLFRRYGIIAAAGDRHLAEFVPDPYLLRPEAANSWMFTLTPVQWRKDNRKKLLDKGLSLVSGEIPVAINPTGEEGVRQMKALLGLGDLVTNVNLPNLFQAPDLPEGAVVETNAFFSKNIVRPMYAGNLDSAVRTLVLRHAQIQTNILEASLERNLKLARDTFLEDPLVRIKASDGERLFNEMVGNTRMWLNDYFK